MSNPKISYYFENEGMPPRAFEVAVQRSTTPRKGKAPWTKLAYHQCRNCPLSTAAFTHCPAAVDIEMVLDAFSEMLQYKTINTTVLLPNGRELRRQGDTPTALSALLGLIMASSPCPVLSRLKGLALTHTPFATPDEQMFRLISTYLLGQMMAIQQGHEGDLSTNGIKHFLNQVEQVNLAFLQRLHVASQFDHAIEGLRLLMVQATNLRNTLDDWVDKMALYAMTLEPHELAEKSL